MAGDVIQVESIEERRKRMARERSRKYAAKIRARLGRSPSSDWARDNPERVVARSKAYYEANKERILARTSEYNKRRPEVNYRAHLKNAYGLLVEDVAAMRAAQGDACKLCGAPFAGARNPDVDHSHATGRIRGLLCRPCNTAVGFYEKRLSKIDPAALLSYLREPTP